MGVAMLGSHDQLNTIYFFLFLIFNKLLIGVSIKSKTTEKDNKNYVLHFYGSNDI